MNIGPAAPEHHRSLAPLHNVKQLREVGNAAYKEGDDAHAQVAYSAALAAAEAHGVTEDVQMLYSNRYAVKH